MSVEKNVKEQRIESNIQVAVRFRPFTKDEKSLTSGPPFKCNRFTNEVITVPGKGESVTYDFDNVFAPSTKQEEVFEKVARPVIDDMLLGYNCTIFAYGQTGTGKTYTMEGNFDDPSQYGIIPRSVNYIFQQLSVFNPKQYHVKISFLEIYNEELYDLFDEDSSKKLKIHEDGTNGNNCRNQLEIEVKNTNEIFEILNKALKRRKTAETNLNLNSSRSHCIFSITLELIVYEGAHEYIRNGKLNLVDLAGSECIGKSGAINKRAREAGNINQSLLALGRVIMALVENNKYIPYRDSKLTYLLRESLGGKAKTWMIATCSPSLLCYEETDNTLKYAYNAKHIKNRPAKNMEITQASIIKELQIENEELKQKLCQSWSHGDINIGYVEYQNLLNKSKEDKETIIRLESESRDLHHRLLTLETELSSKEKLLEAQKYIAAIVDKERVDMIQKISKGNEEIYKVIENKTKEKQKEISMNQQLVSTIEQSSQSIQSILKSLYTNENKYLSQLSSEIQSDISQYKDFCTTCKTQLDSLYNLIKQRETIDNRDRVTYNEEYKELSTQLDHKYKEIDIQNQEYKDTLSISARNCIHTIETQLKSQEDSIQKYFQSLKTQLDSYQSKLQDTTEEYSRLCNDIFDTLLESITKCSSISFSNEQSLTSNYNAYSTKKKESLPLLYQSIQSLLDNYFKEQTEDDQQLYRNTIEGEHVIQESLGGLHNSIMTHHETLSNHLKSASDTKTQLLSNISSSLEENKPQLVSTIISPLSETIDSLIKEHSKKHMSIYEDLKNTFVDSQQQYIQTMSTLSSTLSLSSDSLLRSVDSIYNTIYPSLTSFKPSQQTNQILTNTV
ncbi:hypothetical protein WA158_000103 [Blastocystis sp. Blastoise]